MGFCTKCGRQRTGTEQSCTGCGAQFSDAADATPPVAQPQAEPTPADRSAAQPAPETIVAPAPAGETTVEPAAPAQASVEPAGSAGEPANWAAPQAELPDIEPTRWDTNWYKPGPSPVSQPPAAPAETPQAAPRSPAGPSGPPSYGPPSYGQGGYGQSGQGGGYGPASYAQGSPGPGPAGQGSYGQPPYQPPPHVPGTIGTPPLRRSQTAILTILLVVVLLAVGGGAYALVSRFTGHKASAPPSGNPTLSAPAAGATTPTPTPQSATATASPAQSATGSPTVSPSPVVTVAAGVAANPAEPAVTAFLDRYFTAINTHDYATYNSLLDSEEQKPDTRSSFDAGYGTTSDSAETLTGVAGTASGGEEATVSFTSHQNPADSPTKTSCTSWTITLYLQPNGSSYLIGPAPAGYHASYRTC